LYLITLAIHLSKLNSLLTSSELIPYRAKLTSSILVIIVGLTIIINIIPTTITLKAVAYK
jgi:uncharacterized membrane protein